ncbi:MAG: phage Gp37/Gp68 family protein [Pseudonocardia sp.]|nr:phage Gp37/Gp68 family protein [Pseudonocardia sp.]
MADTSIEWCDVVWNPTSGCDRVSDGCTNCYALTMAKRLKAMGAPGYQRDGNPATSGPGFRLTLHSDKLTVPLHWRRPRRIFVNSMSDLFHADVPDDYIAKVFAVMAATPQHTYQILTKRHARMRNLLSNGQWRDSTFEPAVDELVPGLAFEHPWPLPNVWMGVSVETQQWADIRIPALLQTPAAVHFLSCEPLLGPVTLKPEWVEPVWPRVDWVIVGGESGPHARPMHPDWVRALRDQCTAAGVAYFVKQWGEWAPDGHFAGDPAVLGHNQHAFPGSGDPQFTHTVVRRVGKKAAGRELDGRTWDQYPQAVTA